MIIPAKISRRAVLQSAAVLALGTGGRGVFASQPPPALIPDAEALPMTGTPEAAFAGVDDVISDFILENKIPGGAFAFGRDGKLLYARGYGWGDMEKQEPFAPTSLFRIASVSKPFTCAAVLKLVEARKLSLDDSAFALVPHLTATNNQPDPRLPEITVRHLLHHTGGWDRDVSGDPTYSCRRIASVLGIPGPPTPSEVIRFTMGLPLDFAPGSRYAYSNFGFLLLGRIIETVSKQPYAAFVQENVLRPAGITKMRIGVGKLAGRAPKEVRYYEDVERVMVSSYPNDKTLVPVPYAMPMECMDSNGGWIASVEDLVRFAAFLNASGGQTSILSGRSRHLLTERPAPPVGLDDQKKNDPYYYGLGWEVYELGEGGRFDVWHSGKLDGSSTMLMRRASGVCWALNFNCEHVYGARDAPANKWMMVKKIGSLLNPAIDAAMGKMRTSAAPMPKNKWADYERQ